MSVSLTEAIWALETGYCLWVGAGLTRQVAANSHSVPLWGEITAELESKAGLPPGSDSEDFPHRLDKCFAALGEPVFRGLLRERYYTQLSVDLLSQASKSTDSKDPFPENLRAVAALGQLANPIVSFNIEPLSTILLARPASPVRLLFQSKAGNPLCTWREPGGKFQRLAYHPHGLATADTVMTASQYEANSQTLAFGLAVHASFGNSLAIVGMSLDDEYLRDHLQRYRASIGPIYWFNSHFPPELSAWAEAHGVTTVQVDWGEFWAQWRETVKLESCDLAAAWYLAISEATEEAEGGSLGSLQRSLRDRQQPAAANANLARVAQSLAKAGTALSEPGAKRLIDGKEPRTIELALRARLIEEQIALPMISKTIDPGSARAP